ncbi:MAG: hypothetical protein IKP04_05495 [Candidatus Methanomethylophilaceae archaeon]|nr:hypothetical protein [Candidatus Methanomethylophilaceae archaeon]
MTLEPCSNEKVRKVAKHYGLVPIRIKGTTGIQICKNFNEKKYELISWEDFERTLDEKGLQVYIDSGNPFLKIMKKRTQ